MSVHRTPIAVLGAGSWGTALALQLARNRNHVYLWGHNPQEMAAMRASRVNQKYLAHHPLPENISIEVDLDAALAPVQDVLVVVPSDAFRSMLRMAKPFFKNELRLVWGTKGLDPDSCLTLDEVAKEEVGLLTPLAVLSGPSFAIEVARGLPTAVTLASTDQDFADSLVARFRGFTFRLYQSTDLIGVELCGVYKNVLAIAAGMSDGLKLGANARSALITRGIAELARLIEACGGDKETLLGLAGVGDIILTCTTDTSRNRRFGLLLGAGKSKKHAIEQIGQVVEGAINAQQLHHLAQHYGVDMPIATQVYQVLFNGRTPDSASKELLMRGSKPNT